jgi:hypothetical protein
VTFAIDDGGQIGARADNHYVGKRSVPPDPLRQPQPRRRRSGRPRHHLRAGPPRVGRSPHNQRARGRRSDPPAPAFFRPEPPRAGGGPCAGASRPRP